MDDLLFGLRTTAVGMGIVFGVLAILWALLTAVPAIERLAARRARPVATPAPEERDASAATSAPASGAPVVRIEGAPGTLDPRLVAAITVAILRHEEARRLQAAPAMRSYWPGSLLFASRWVAAGRTRQGAPWRRSRR